MQAGHPYQHDHTPTCKMVIFTDKEYATLIVQQNMKKFRKENGKSMHFGYYLMIAFDRFWKRMVNDKPNIGLIDTYKDSCQYTYELQREHMSRNSIHCQRPLFHLSNINFKGGTDVVILTHAKGYCRTYNVDFILAPLFLYHCSLFRIHASVVKCCLVPILLKT